jgi:HAD superfamily phosphatase (TIGR01668 family)
MLHGILFSKKEHKETQMTFIKRSLVPDATYNSMAAVPLQSLREMGFRAALLDLDNTIAEDRVTEPSSYTHQIIKDLTDAGFVCCIVSNAKSTRSSDFASALGVACVSYANKPSPKGVFRALQLLQVDAKDAVFFGDQIFTDIMAAKRAGVYAVLIEPVSKNEMIYIRVKRPFERIVRWIYRF